jgi:hypothetical protein
MGKNIVWISSYPKSGNTWIRILLESLLYKNGGRVDLNQMKIRGSSKIKRYEFNSFFGLDSSDLTLEETWEYKREYLTYLAKNENERVYIKTHNANLILNSGKRLIPNEITSSAIYIVRNPLDVVGSLANHNGYTFDHSIAEMNQKHHFNHKEGDLPRCTTQLYAIKDTWSNNVESWLSNPEFPVHLIRYEDLIEKPIETLSLLLSSLGIEIRESVVKEAVCNSSFDTLSTYENEVGFLERPHLSKSFFRRGKAGTWKTELNDRQIERVIKDHSSVMTKMGYL